MRLVKCIILASVMGFLLQPKCGLAGPYTDELTRCIVESTTTQDRTTFVRWLFVALSLHPDVSDLANVPEDQYEKANKSIAELSVRLLTVSCKQQAVKAVQYEGDIAIRTSFQVLGQIAAKEIFSHPDVAAGMANLEKYIDSDKLNSTLTEKD